MSMTESANAFALPPRLCSRKRKAPLAADSEGGPESAARLSSSLFFTEAGYARFSAYGEAAASKFYADEELRRATCLTTISSSSTSQSLASAARTGAKAVKVDSDAFVGATGTAASVVQKLLQPPIASVQRPSTPRGHLMQILLEKKGKGKMHVRVDNAARRLSSLAVLHHEQYMQLLQKRIHAQRCGIPVILALTTDELAQWQTLDVSVREEQAAMYRDLEAIAKSELAPAMTFVPVSVELWYEKMLMQCRNDVFQMYPRYFEPSLRITTQGEAANSELCVMKHVKEVFSHGACPAAHEERFVNGMQITITTMDDTATSSGEDGSAFLIRSAISADVHAEKLMEKYDCDVAISSSTLVTLFDFERQEGFSKPREWLIPVKSRVVMTKNGVAKKHVYFDKPLPAENVSAREKIGLAGRASLLTNLQINANESMAPPQSPHANATRGRTVYHVWELGGRRILVRCTTHAHLVAKASPKEDVSKSKTAKSEPTIKAQGGAPAPGNSHPLSVFIKPDYRFLGIDEQITRSEKRRFWLHSWLRGSSVLMIGRLNPQSCAVESWEKHSLASLVYGHDATHPPEWFEPTENFQTVNEAFAAVCSVPAGNHMVKSDSNGAIELLMATSGPVISSSDANNKSSVENSEVLDLFQFIGSARDSSKVLEFVLPKWSYQQGRIPYCFRTGTYCLPFFVGGVCPKIADKERCDAVHLRQSQSRSRGNRSSSSSSNTSWRFDDYSLYLKTASKASQEAHSSSSFPTHVNWLQPTFPFCQMSQSVDPGNPRALVRCPKPKGECLLPHLTVHEVAERLADNELRRKREQTKKFKKGYRERRSSRQLSR